MNQIKDVKEIKECPDCASMNIVLNQQRDQVVCKDCGLIFEQMIPIDGTMPVPVDILPKKAKTSPKKSVKKKKK